MIRDQTALDHTLSDLIEMVDQIGQGLVNWQEFTKTLVEIVPGSVGVFLRSSHNPLPDNIVHHGYDPALLHAYTEHFAPLNPWNGFWRRAGLGRAYPSSRMMPSSSFSHTEFYNDWLRKLDGRSDGTGIKLAADRDTILSIVLHLPDARLSESEAVYCRVLEGISGALVRAVSRGIADEDVRNRAVANAALIGREPEAALVIDVHLNIVDANAEAVAALRRGDIVIGRGSKVQIADSVVQTWLREATGAMFGRRPWSEHSRLAEIAETLCRFTVLPLSVGSSATFVSPFQRSLFILKLRRLDRGIVTGIDLVCRHFRLSPAERKLCERLIAGETVQEAADGLGISQETARDRLKQIFRKTDVRRQSELVSLLLRLG
jgi:DNA-binding CsgD family transcriptional regulator